MVRNDGPKAKKQKVSNDNSNSNDSSIPEPDVCENFLLNLTTHVDNFDTNPIPLRWGHPDPVVRGPILCTIRHQVSVSRLHGLMENSEFKN